MPSHASDRPPRPTKTAVVLTTSVLTAVLILIGIGAMWLVVQTGAGLGPTPTPTPTAVDATRTPTPDRRATNVAEDMLAQIAYAATIVGQRTPSAVGVAPDPAPGTEALTPLPTSNVQLPIVVMPGTPDDVTQQTTPGIASVTPVSETVFIPNVGGGGPLPSATEIPFVPPADTVTPIPPTPTIFILPTDTPTVLVPTPFVPPTSTATPFVLVSELNAISRPADTAVRNGPSLAYTQTATIGPNTRIQLRGRTPPGDWVYGCCVNNQELFWIRQAFVTITDNPLPPGVPEDANPNDPRYLPIQTQDASLPVRPIPTGIPPSDFPLARYNVRNTGRVPSLPQPPFAPKWTNAGQAGGDFSSPAAIRGNTLIAGSRDSQLYGLYTEAGNQLWRYDLQGVVQYTPAIQDGLIYVTFNGNRAAALQEQGTLYWQSDLPANTTTAFQIWLDTLFVGAGDGTDARLIALRRDNPGERREFTTPVSRVQLPAVGQETIFVGADRLWALDSNFFLLNEPEVVWTSNDVTNITVPPVYSYPGVVRLAELYVADAGNNVHALDANTGARFWTQPMGAAIASLALNDNSLFVVGSGYVRALSRTDGQTLWSQPLNDNVPGGALVTNDRLLIVLESGGIFTLDAITGATIDAASAVPGGLAGAVAVSNLTIYAPSKGNSVYAYRGGP